MIMNGNKDAPWVGIGHGNILRFLSYATYVDCRRMAGYSGEAISLGWNLKILGCLSADRLRVNRRPVCAGEMIRLQLETALGLKDDEHFGKAYLLPALEVGLIEMTIPEQPRNSRQKCRLTNKERAAVTNWWEAS